MAREQRQKTLKICAYVGIGVMISGFAVMGVVSVVNESDLQNAAGYTGAAVAITGAITGGICWYLHGEDPKKDS